ncbi:unnamed protein product [Knipowitschia caucasica]
MLAELGLIGTLQDDELSPQEPESESGGEDEPIVLNRKKKQGKRRHGAKDFNADFEFGEKDVGQTEQPWLSQDVLNQMKPRRTATSLDQKIEQVRKKRKAQEKGSTDEALELKPDLAEPAGSLQSDHSDEESDESEAEFSSGDEKILTKSDTLKDKERKGKRRRLQEQVSLSCPMVQLCV